MSEKIEVEREGVSLTKYYDGSEYSLPSVVYELRSNRSEAASIRIVEPITGSLDQGHIGFRKEESQHNWTVSETELVFDCELAAGADYETVFALRPEASYDPQKIVTEPEAFEVTPVGSVAVHSEQTGSFTRSAGSDGEIENGGGEDTDDGTESDETEIQIESIGDKSLSATETTTDTNATGEQSTDTEPLVDRLVAELEAKAGSKESREYLQETLGTGGSESLDARIRQLQTDLSDLRAYTNALEEFLDDNGSAEELIAEFESRMDSFESELASLESSFSKQKDTTEDIREQNESLQDRLESTSASLNSLSGDVDEIRAELNHLDEQIPDGDIDERMTAIEDEVEELTTFMSDLRSVLGRNTDDR